MAPGILRDLLRHLLKNALFFVPLTHLALFFQETFLSQEETDKQPEDQNAENVEYGEICEVRVQSGLSGSPLFMYK